MPNRRRFVSHELVIETYKRLLHQKGKASCGDVAKELGKMGVRTRLGQIPSRQAVHQSMVQSSEGRSLLLQTKKRIGKDGAK